MSNPFAQTMTPPFTGELWRAARENNLSSGVESRHATNRRPDRSVTSDLGRVNSVDRPPGSQAAGVAPGLLNPLPEAEDPRASKLDSLPWGNLGQDWPASR